MRTGITIALSLVAGFAVGATAINSLKAQVRSPAYFITDFSEITNPAGFAEAAKGLPASLAAGGGRLVARSDTLVELDGPAPKRFAIFAFDSVEKAKAWYSSDLSR
jgi:uncharacterized protein (DUF1330 family)